MLTTSIELWPIYFTLPSIIWLNFWLSNKNTKFRPMFGPCICYCFSNWNRLLVVLRMLITSIELWPIYFNLPSIIWLNFSLPHKNTKFRAMFGLLFLNGEKRKQRKRKQWFTYALNPDNQISKNKEPFWIIWDYVFCVKRGV